MLLFTKDKQYRRKDTLSLQSFKIYGDWGYICFELFFLGLPLYLFLFLTPSSSLYGPKWAYHIACNWSVIKQVGQPGRELPINRTATD